MYTPIITTKLTIPPLSNTVITRARLIESLNRKSGLRLTLLLAAAGSGKTTLLASWLQGLQEPQAPPSDPPRIAWFSVEEEDNDPNRFLTYFIAALEAVAPGIGEAVQPLMLVFQVGNSKQIMAILINALAQTRQESLVVLDDFHCITNEELIAAVGYFIDHLPSHFRVILASREEPPLPLHRWRARGESSEITGQDLRFRGEETEAFLTRTMGLALPPDAVASLENRTEGWAAGLQMAALSLRSELDSADPELLRARIEKFTGDHRYVIDYLAAEVIRRQPAEIRQFLVKTSILDCFNASLCNAVAEQEDSQALLLRLEKANLFLISLDTNRQWYRYHHLFADVLRAELSTEEQCHLHLLASQWYEANGMTTEAIKHAVQARQPEIAVGLIRNREAEMIRIGDVATIYRWLMSLPEDVVVRERDLLAKKGWLLYLRGEIRAAENIAALVMQDGPIEESPAQRGIVSSFRAYVHLVHGESARAVKAAQEACNLLAGSSSPILPAAKSVLGVAHEHLGNFKEAADLLQEAIDLGIKNGNQITSLGALAYRIKLLKQQGKLSEAIARCQEIVSLFSDSRGNLMPMAFSIAVSFGEAYYERNDLIAAKKYLSAGLALSQQIGMPYSTLDGQLALAKLYFALEQHKEVEEILEAARELTTRFCDPRYLRMYKTLKAELLMRMGRIQEAADTLDDLPADPADLGKPEQLLRARLLLMQNRLGPAVTLLHRLEEYTQRQGHTRSLITIHLRQAQACQALRRADEAQRYLEKALLLAGEEGYRRLFLDEGPGLAVMVSQLPAETSSFVASLQAALAPAPAEPAGAVQIQNEFLSQTQVEILRLVALGCSNRDIASKLGITEGTTKWHLNQIYGKLNVHSRTQAIAQAQQLRILQ